MLAPKPYPGSQVLCIACKLELLLTWRLKSTSQKYIISMILEQKQDQHKNMTIEKVDTWIYGQLQLSMTWQRFDQTAHQFSCPCMLVVLQKEKGSKES
jgi:hypothetical protein